MVEFKQQQGQHGQQSSRVVLLYKLAGYILDPCPGTTNCSHTTHNFSLAASPSGTMGAASIVFLLSRYPWAEGAGSGARRQGPFPVPLIAFYKDTRSFEGQSTTYSGTGTLACSGFMVCWWM